MTVDTQKTADLLQRFGGLSTPSEQQLAEHKARAYRMLDSQTRGSCVSINANELIDLVACASALPALLDEIDRLREALRPFAKEADTWGTEECSPDSSTLYVYGSCGGEGDAVYTVGDLRRARAVLNPTAPPQGEKDDH